MKEIDPNPRITAEAIKALAEWALEQLPPLEIIAACDRTLWWVGEQAMLQDIRTILRKSLQKRARSLTPANRAALYHSGHWTCILNTLDENSPVCVHDANTMRAWHREGLAHFERFKPA